MTLLHFGTSYTQDIMFYSKEDVSATHQIVWEGPLNVHIAWVARGHSPIRTPLTGEHPFWIFPRNPYLGQMATEKPSTF